MAETSLELFIKNLSMIVETKIFPAGCSRTQTDLKLLLTKQKFVDNVYAGFNTAVLKVFCDSIQEILDNIKISQKELKSKPSTINARFRCPLDYMESMRIQTKLCHKQCLKSLITEEMQKILVVKKRLMLSMTRTLNKKNELTSLQLKEKSCIPTIESTDGLQQIIPTDFIIM